MDTAVQQNDPFLLGIAFLLAVVVGLVAIAKPLMGLYREYKRTDSEIIKAEVDETKSSVEVFLYQQLQQQIEKNTADIHRLQSERDSLFRKATLLEREVERLKSFEAMVNLLKADIKMRDALIAQRDREISELAKVILDMKGELQSFGLRLTRDENTFASSTGNLSGERQNGDSSIT